MASKLKGKAEINGKVVNHIQVPAVATQVVILSYVGTPTCSIQRSL